MGNRGGGSGKRRNVGGTTHCSGRLRADAIGLRTGLSAGKESGPRGPSFPTLSDPAVLGGEIDRKAALKAPVKRSRGLLGRGGSVSSFGFPPFATRSSSSSCANSSGASSSSGAVSGDVWRGFLVKAPSSDPANLRIGLRGVAALSTSLGSPLTLEGRLAPWPDPSCSPAPGGCLISSSCDCLSSTWPGNTARGNKPGPASPPALGDADIASTPLGTATSGL